MKNMIGYCGLDCEKCDAYLATINDDQITPQFCRNILTARAAVRTERKQYFVSICAKSGNVL